MLRFWQKHVRFYAKTLRFFKKERVLATKLTLFQKILKLESSTVFTSTAILLKIMHNLGKPKQIELI